MILETSVDGFIDRFRVYATEGEMHPRAEGSALLEFSSAKLTLYLLERTSPYHVRHGLAQVIVHPILKTCKCIPASDEHLFPNGISSLEGRGHVIKVSPGFMVVQAKITLVLGLLAPSETVVVGDWIQFTTEAPIHGFVL
ncbi:MAG: hypothetical protein U0Z75_01250 [Deinococcaceae bacterium]